MDGRWYAIVKDPLLHASILSLDSFYLFFYFDDMTVIILPCIDVYIYTHTDGRLQYYRGSILINTGRFVLF